MNNNARWFVKIASQLAGIAGLGILCLIGLALLISFLLSLLPEEKIAFLNTSDEPIVISFINLNHDNGEIYQSHNFTVLPGKTQKYGFGFNKAICLVVNNSSIALPDIEDGTIYSIWANNVKNFAPCSASSRAFNSTTSLPDGEWQWKNDNRFTLTTSRRSLQGHMICNSLAAEVPSYYIIDHFDGNGRERSTIHLSVGSTEVGCDGNDLEQEYLGMLNNVHSYETTDGSITFFGQDMEPMIFEKIR